MFFDELSNDEWALLAPLASDEPAIRLNRRGRPRAEPRIVANAVLWILTTGEPWSKLPGRYPSGPTCRRRFEEWQLNGTLLEMVRLLSQTGRTFAYVPQPAPPVAVKPAAPQSETPRVREEATRGVSWKSAESWQSGALNATSGSNAFNGWRSADAIGDITRQLSGIAEEEQLARVERRGHRSGHGEAGRSVDVNRQHYDRHESYADPREDRRNSLSMSLAPRGSQVSDQRGFVIYVVAEQVPNAMYRGWAEIMKDGKRVERSGLVGPRFADAESAEQFAHAWAQQWIDRQCRTLAAAGTAPTQVATARPLPPMRHIPEPTSLNHTAQLRRYPGETAAVENSTADRSDRTDRTDRYPASPELISHAG